MYNHQQSSVQSAPHLTLTASTPRISVIIPVLNEEKLLPHTLSIFTPALREQFGIELIISDGGSTDATLQIAECAADIIVRHSAPHRQTIAAGRNAGAEHASGDILMFLNGDTIPADPIAFFETVEHYLGTKSSKETKTRCSIINNDTVEQPLALACPVEIAPFERQWSDVLFHGFFNTYIRILNTLGIGIGRGECQVIRASVFRRLGGYNPAIAAGEDYDLYRRARAVGRIAVDRRTLVYESPRRFRRFGYLRVLYLWSLNALSVIIRHKAVADEWEAVR
jgi:glycosyltransferase involved in cell wall biosynthesis